MDVFLICSFVFIVVALWLTCVFKVISIYIEESFR